MINRDATKREPVDRSSYNSTSGVRHTHNRKDATRYITPNSVQNATARSSRARKEITEIEGSKTLAKRGPAAPAAAVRGHAPMGQLIGSCRLHACMCSSQRLHLTCAGSLSKGRNWPQAGRPSHSANKEPMGRGLRSVDDHEQRETRCARDGS